MENSFITRKISFGPIRRFISGVISQPLQKLAVLWVLLVT